MNNNPNSNLNDFLNKNKQNLTDDFEKDAFEGFETLNSTQEAFELKSTLDKKITQKLFVQKKETKKVVWYAAAGFFLIIGFSVFFILNNENAIVKNNDVSLITPLKNEELATEEKDKIVPADLPLKLENEKTKGLITTAKQNDLSKTQQTEAEESEILADKIVEKQAPKKASDSDVDNLSFAKNTEPNSQMSSPASTVKADDDAKLSTAKAPVMVGGIKDNESDAAKDEVAFSETKSTGNSTKNVATNTTLNGQGKQNSQKEFKTEPKKESDREETSVGTSRKKEKTKSRATVKEDKPSQIVAASMDANQQAGSENYKGDAEGKVVDAKSSNNQCYYNGGQNQLLNDIAEKLIAKNVNKKFDATLLINEKKQVDKVIFINLYNLTLLEKTSIETELKSLKNFSFYINPNTKILYEYKLEYKP